MISLPKEEYRLIKNAPEDLASLTKLYKKNEIFIKVNFKDGSFHGKYKEINFKGKYNILKVNSGLSKGFNYNVELEELSSDLTQTKSEEQFMATLAKCTAIYIGPDRLYNPQYFKMNFQVSENLTSFYMITGL